MKCPDRPLKEELHSDSITKNYEIQVITPIFGGGVETGVNDPITPIRTSSIRGHLRFWWRATRGKIYKTLPELRQREGEIWGTTENPSAVTIELDGLDSSAPSKRFHPDHGFPNRFGSEAYVLFSAREKNSDIIREGFSFSLKVRWPKHKKLQQMRDKENEVLKHQNKPMKGESIEDIGTDIDEALRAWVNFGGIGARTRRGCGALFCEQLAPKSVADLKRYSFTILNKSGPKDPLDAWVQSVRVIKDFRQSFRGPKHKKQITTRNGIKIITSFWKILLARADSIRKITECALKPPNVNNFDHSVPRLQQSSSQEQNSVCLFCFTSRMVRAKKQPC